MPKPRVLLVAQEVHPIPPVKGAAVEQWIDSVAHRLRRYEPHIVSVPHPLRPDEETTEGVHYHRVRIGRLYNRLFRKISRWDPYSYADRVTKYLRKIDADIVHVHNAPLLFNALQAKGRIAILHMHNEKEDDICAGFDALVGCSRYITDWYRQRGVRARYLATLPNGVDTDRFRPPHSRADALLQRSSMKIPTDRFVILYAGRISPEKGPDLLARAARHLDSGRFHLVLVGEWPKGDPAKSRRVKFAEDLRGQLAGVPHTLIDTVPPEDMPRMYRLGDLLVIPSRFEEPFSMVAIEAMACGVPVMAVSKGGMPEYMVDGQNAVLIDGEAGDRELAHAILDASADRGRLEGIAAQGRATVQQCFTWGEVTRQTEALYDLVLKGHPVRSSGGTA